eukprot:Rmarinus@m.7269
MKNKKIFSKKLPFGDTEISDRPDEFNLFVGTWNVGNMLPGDLSHWIPPLGERNGTQYDMIVVACQEAHYSSDSSDMKAQDKKNMLDILDEETLLDEAEIDPTAPRRKSLRVDETKTLKLRQLRKSQAVGLSIGFIVGLASVSIAGPLAIPLMYIAGKTATQSYNEAKSRNHWRASVQKILGDDFEEIGCHMLMQMRLVVLVRRRHKPFIKNVELSTEATGLFDVIGNKGGIGIKCDLYGTSMCFVGSHLAAHEGEFYCQARNENVEEITRGIRVMDKKIDFCEQADHTIWCGDLNYRVDPGLSDEKLKLPPNPKNTTKQLHEARWNWAHTHVKKQRWDLLYACDELVQQIRQGRVFHGFQEFPPQFAPTFKVKREEFREYTKQRVPSYCDRILCRSKPNLTRYLTQESFVSCPKLKSSDHKPVYATYRLRFPPVFPIPEALPGPPDAVVAYVLRFEEIEAGIDKEFHTEQEFLGVGKLVIEAPGLIAKKVKILGKVSTDDSKQFRVRWLPRPELHTRMFFKNAQQIISHLNQYHFIITLKAGQTKRTAPVCGHMVMAVEPQSSSFSFPVDSSLRRRPSMDEAKQEEITRYTFNNPLVKFTQVRGWIRGRIVIERRFVTEFDVKKKKKR